MGTKYNCFVKMIRWDLTKYCNLSCKHCQSSQYKDRDYHFEELSTEDVFKIIENLAIHNVRSVGLLGGEPTIRRDFLDVLKRLFQRKMSVTVNTNGMLIDSVMAKGLIHHANAVIVSMDGVSRSDHDMLRETGSFDGALRGINELRKARLTAGNPNPLLGMNFVVNRYNLGTAHLVPEFAKEVGVDFVGIDAIHKTGAAKENWDHLAVSDKELVSLSRILFRKLHGGQYPNVSVKFASNMLREFLNLTEELDIEYQFVGEAPGIRTMFIRSDGVALPSQALSYNGVLCSGLNRVSEKDLSKIASSPEFIAFNAMYERRLFVHEYYPCRLCRFSGNLCNPSPTAYFLHQQTPVSICKYVFPQLTTVWKEKTDVG